MNWKARVLLLLCAFTIGSFWLVKLKRASAAEISSVPVLTVMGKVADTSEAVETKVFDDFRRQSGVRVRLAQSLQTVTERIDLFTNLFQKHSPEPDLLDLDVIWPATLGKDLIDLRPYFREEIKDFAPEILRNFEVDGRLIALPTFVDAGVLYYRHDLLKKYGFNGPPKTWDELGIMAQRIQVGERAAGNRDFWGYLWQGGAYESLTCNALEWQSSSGGGEILGSDRTVQVRNPQFRHALERAVSWIGTISPPGQSAFGEDDGMNFWMAGKAAFMRNWTGKYAPIIYSNNPVNRQTSVAAMPGVKGRFSGTLGGSGTGISRYSPHPQLALQILRMIVSESTQRERALKGGYIPSRIDLREKPEVMALTPLHGNVGGDVVRNLVARPALQAGSSYNAVSRAYYGTVHAILTRELTPDEGLARLEDELVHITGFRARP